MIEAFIIAVMSAIVSTILLFVLLYLLQPWIDNTYGILVNIEMLSLEDIFIFIYFILAAMLVSLIPAMRAYWFSINDGMTCLLYTSPSPRDGLLSRMPSSA